MMTRELRARFLKAYESALPAIDQSLTATAPLNRRRTAVRLLNDRLAARFGIVSSESERATEETRQALDAADKMFSSFSFVPDERAATDAISPEILGTVVEQFAVDRARQGVYYTPVPVVRYICRSTMEVLLGIRLIEVPKRPAECRSEIIRILDKLRVIDPACGCGAFLIGMFHELLEWNRILKTSQSAEKIANANLFGIDLDDLAIHTTRIRLALAVQSAPDMSQARDQFEHIAVGDALSPKSSGDFDEMFDLVVTNPPFGVTVSADLRDRFFDCELEGPQSKDAYGLFILRCFQLLRPGGVGSLLVSDTWRTIRRHRPLRKRLVQHSTVHRLIDLPTWIFPATVNTGIITFTRSTPQIDSEITAADLRSLEKENWPALENDLAAVADPSPEQTPTGAVYQYHQRQIGEYDNYSFFIASPRLHRIVTDVQYTTLGEIATVRQGLATGDNKRYLRKQSRARGSYTIVDLSEILSDRDLSELTSDEKVNGVNPAKYGGRKFVPYDKGGASSSQHSWLPNYYVPTEYFIDWSETAVERMKTATSARQRGKIAARFQNSQQYFKRGITFSYTGFYAPCFRLSSGGVFDVGGSSCFDLQLPLYPTLAILASKLLKYVGRNFINHTVNFQVDDFKALPLPRDPDPAISAQLDALVSQIVAKQKADPRYPYHRHEQIAIDRLVYRLFELTEEDIREVERWYGRRYGRLFNIPSSTD
jgi:hypothetical protein